jgi:hypothetical protein
MEKGKRRVSPMVAHSDHAEGDEGEMRPAKQPRSGASELETHEEEVLEEELKELRKQVDDKEARLQKLKLDKWQSQHAPQENDKFLEHELTYGHMRSFFAGLEGLVGPPSVSLNEAIELEHCGSTDSHESFKAPNYGTETTSCIEYHFVVPRDRAPLARCMCLLRCACLQCCDLFIRCMATRASSL